MMECHIPQNLKIERYCCGNLKTCVGGLEWHDGHRKLYGGCTVALSGVMVVESYMVVVQWP